MKEKDRMRPCIAVIIPTKGRPLELANLLATLELQTRRPDKIIISASEPSDIPEMIDLNDRVQVVLGSPGLPAQRNRAWAPIKGTVDTTIFFDDDFIPSRFWIERAHAFLAAHPSVVCLTGRVIIDGVRLTGLDLAEGPSCVKDADLSAKPFSATDCVILDNEPPYGCNMAIRGGILDHLTFDERLVLYGWLEDRDFGIRAAAAGRIVWTDALWGVHLGTKQGRQSELRFGYSQVVNPWYLMKKGVLTPYQAGHNIFRGFVGNAIGSVFPNLILNPRADRPGRLKGNLIGMKDILLGSWAPEKVIHL